MQSSILIEGYASLFGVADLSADTVRAGAFSRSLSDKPFPKMLLQHKTGAIAGRWTQIQETGLGLYVRGMVDTGSAQSLVRSGLNGLSIGFRPRLWRPKSGKGRELIDVELVEVSLVSDPMLPDARFTVLSQVAAQAA